MPTIASGVRNRTRQELSTPKVLKIKREEWLLHKRNVRPVGVITTYRFTEREVLIRRMTKPKGECDGL
jgi:hypothetical protein